MIEGPTRQEAVTRGYLRIPGLPDGDLELPYVEIQGADNRASTDGAGRRARL